MVDYREILRLDKENYSQRQIEASTAFREQLRLAAICL